MIVNNAEAGEHWMLPQLEVPGQWVLTVDTDRPTVTDEPLDEITLVPSSLVMLRYDLEAQ
jgi:hypothetical protein